MTREEYMSKVYVGKHEKHKYKICRVLKPFGFEETIYVYGRQAVKDAAKDTLDIKIKDCTTGKEVFL